VTDALPEDWWSTEDVATFLSIGTSTVSAYVTRHQMPQPDRYIGRTRLWLPDTIREWQQIRPRSGAQGVNRVARVEWSRQSGDEVEAVLGILLCREHPTATRVKASVGDGGIDVWVPEGETATVYQIKSYTGNISSTRQGHIKKSWETLLAYAKENSITLSAWYLVTPENPTKEQLKWFKELTKGVTFPCAWRGLDFVDGLAAKYPEVIDYYLRDGKDRLEETVRLLLSVAGLKNPAASPASSIDSLNELHAALNKFDPHFRYDFSVQTLNADGTCPPQQITPDTIASIRFTDNERCITYNIAARFKEALKERPAPGSMTLAAMPESPLHHQIDDWTKYGTPLKDVPAKKISWDLPGGFGGSWEDARVTVGTSKPLPGAVHETITLRISETDGSVVASLDFVTEEASSGVSGKGVRSVGHDRAAGLVRYELRMLKDDDEDQIAANLNISAEEPAGRFPADMLPGIRFLAAARPPRQIQVFSRNGPALSPPLPIPQGVVSEEQGKLWILMCESLATIQQHVIERIKFPDMMKYHPVNFMDDVEQWWQAAALLRGETLAGSWNSAVLHLQPGVEPSAELDQATAMFSGEYGVRIGPKTYQLGIINAQVATVQVNPAVAPVLHEDHLDVEIIPRDDSATTIHLVSGASAVGSSEILASS
jgi:hypothetical protein